MPKVIFRPNPTPPPFVPPVPSYDTRVDFYMRPLQYEAEQYVEVKIPSGNYPASSVVLLCQKNNGSEDFISILEFDNEPSNYNTILDFFSEYGVDSTTQFILKFQISANQTYEIPAYPHLLEN